MRLIALASMFLGAALTQAQMCMGPPPTPTRIAVFASGTLLDGVGTSDMPVTSSNESVRSLCRQGFALIHCFWFHEAIRSFRDATVLDPDCATAWLGLHIACTQPWVGRQTFKAEADYALWRAIQRIESASQVEQALIVAYRTRATGTGDYDAGFERAMADVLARFPDVWEPRLLWAGMRCQNCMGRGYLPNGDVRGELRKVSELIAPVGKKNPTNHAYLHYHIHAEEPSNPKAAERSADWIGKIASRSSHMVHMAGHIYNRIGRYADAHAAFSRARDIEIEDAKSLGVSPFEANWNHGHNLAFMAMNLAEMGKTDEALGVMKGASWERGLILWRAGRWGELVDWAKAMRRDPNEDIDAAFFWGMAAVARKDRQEAAGYAKRLAELVEEDTEGRDIKRLGTDTRIAVAQRHELEGALRFLEGDVPGAVAALEAAIRAFDAIEYEEPVIYPRIPHETLGWGLLAAGQRAEAHRAFEWGLKVRPHSPWLTAGVERCRPVTGRGHRR